jgi:hypothetical protein
MVTMSSFEPLGSPEIRRSLGAVAGLRAVVEQLVPSVEQKSLLRTAALRTSQIRR